MPKKKRDESLKALFKRKKGIEQGTNRGKTVIGGEKGNLDLEQTRKALNKRRRGMLR